MLVFILEKETTFIAVTPWSLCVVVQKRTIIVFDDEIQVHDEETIYPLIAL